MDMIITLLRSFVRRIWYVTIPHQHSIYCWCPECHNFGINLPNDPTCGNCGYKACIEYYPVGTPAKSTGRAPRTVYLDEEKRNRSERHV